MKTVKLLLLMLPLGFTCFAQATQPKIKVIHNDRLVTSVTKSLSAKSLRKIYGKAFKVSKIEPNYYEPAVRDTLLTANTGTDKLDLFTNKYNSFLLSAHFTSQRLTFGHAIRVGTSKAVFCQALGLPEAFDGYRLVVSEGETNIFFLFQKGVLVSVNYQVGEVEYLPALYSQRR